MIRLLEAQRHVGAGLADEPLLDVARRHQLALAPGQRAVVDEDAHGDRGRIDLHEMQRRAVFLVGDRLADEHVLEAAQADDVARARVLEFDLLHALMAENRRDVRALAPPIAVDADDRVAHAHATREDAPIGDPAQVIAVVEVGDEHLQILVAPEPVGGGICLMISSKSGVMSLRSSVDFLDRVAGLGAGVDHREIELLVAGVEFHEQLEHHVEHLVGPGVLAVDLVDDHDHLRAALHGLFEHELGLRLRAVVAVHDQQHAVDHAHDALDLAAEVGVAGGVHDVDVVAVVLESGVLGADGDALFALQVHGIHHALVRLLVGAEGAGLAQQAIDEGGLAMVNVGNDGNISDLIHKREPPRAAGWVQVRRDKRKTPLPGKKFNVKSESVSREK